MAIVELGLERSAYPNVLEQAERAVCAWETPSIVSREPQVFTLSRLIERDGRSRSGTAQQHRGLRVGH
ncbi:MAG: hypothetical protein J6S96_00345 [Muribaculaceae bacterium]|nr:hypothetical protein [Muribaculaceae bacterium]